MSGKYRKLQRVLKNFIKFKEVLKAIKFVSGASLASLRKELNSRYEALSSVISLVNNEFFTDEYNNVLVISIFEDRGCCGPHNNNIRDYSTALINYFEDSNININLYVIGNKGVDQLRKLFSKYYVGGLIDYNEVKFHIDMSYLVLKNILAINNNNYDRLFIVFNRYISTQVQKVLGYEITSYIDYIKSLFLRLSNNDKISFFFGVLIKKSDLFLNNLYLYIISMLLSDALSDNKYCFLASRFIAMENAINNVEDLIQLFTLQYNKARQESITSELIEIITCSQVIEK
jgi:F-type H+-transporting ATPase subunit gamma